MNKNNMEIRELIERKRLKYYEVAQALNITPFTFSVWLRDELRPERKKEVIQAIKSIKL